MNAKIEGMIERLSDEEGRINCATLMGIARRLGISPERVGEVADEAGFRIKDCELGQFGDKPVDEFDEEVYRDLKNHADIKGRVTCFHAWAVAKKYGLKRVRSTIKSSDIGVIYCQLGCFREKKRPRLRVKTKLWIENKRIGMVLGKGKVEILELIDRSGSISSVAKQIGVSYKKVWDHIQVLERNMGKRFVITFRGRNSGGSVITDEAKELIEKFRRLQDDVEEYANRRFVELFYDDRKYRNKMEVDR